MKDIIKLIDALADAAWSAGNESGQGSCGQSSYRVEMKADERQKAAREALIAKIREKIPN